MQSSDAGQTLGRDVVQHHLRLMGFNKDTNLSILDRPGVSAVPAVLGAAKNGGVCVALQPDMLFANALDVTMFDREKGEAKFFSVNEKFAVGMHERLCSLHTSQAYHHIAGIPVVLDSNGRFAWMWLPLGSGGVLFIGSDLANDFIRYRQGDPLRARVRPQETMWGIPGERPNYLFDQQLADLHPAERQADFWAMTLAACLSKLLDSPLGNILPGGAVGALVITGDDDQAYLEKYEEQLKLLGDIPITYLLHPLTRHTKKSLRAMQKQNPGVDFGIHPDALEAPERYNELFDEQIDWYKKLTGNQPISLRNHGFLNDGYWGHLAAWLKREIRISSNLPGFDGQVLNGSLLPARMVWNEALTSHWSVLTVIGDGVRFASGMSDEDAADRVRNVAQRIRESGVPGVMVLNLHPQNVTETRAMHQAAIEVIRSGFVAWNLRQCWEWFSIIDQSYAPASDREWESMGWLYRLWHSSRKWKP
jgi:hypothetical protein